jgi:hypothetical protein
LAFFESIRPHGKMPLGLRAKMAVLPARSDHSAPAVFESVMFSIITAGG